MNKSTSCIKLKGIGKRLLSILMAICLVMINVVDVSATVSVTSANDMSYERGMYPAATLLTNGDVIVIGGIPSSGGSLGNAEIYDTSNGTWSTIANSMNETRCYLATNAITLDDGNVFIAGGDTYGDGLNINGLETVEILDTSDANPDNWTWSYAANMSTVRYYHQTVKLDDGRVMAIGGSDSGGLYSYLASCEIYNPDTDSWSAAASMNEVKNVMGATVLNDGRVLIAGGDNAATDGRLATCEIYDPVANTWSVVESLPVAVAGPSLVTLADGRAFLMGGNSGDVGSVQAETKTYYYYPERDEWEEGPDMGSSEARSRGIGVRFDENNILFAGGGDNDSNKTNSATLFTIDPPEATNIAVDTGSLSPSFNEDIYTYSVNIGDANSIGVTVTDDDAIEINGTTTSTTTKRTVSLSESSESVYVDITDGDKTTRRYTINVTANEYDITYYGNSNTGGSVPSADAYLVGNTATISNQGTLSKTGYSFDGWNTQGDDTGTDYASSYSFTMSASDINLYAVWDANSNVLTYDKNDGTATTVTSNHDTDATLTLTDQGFTRDGYTFSEWNTASNGGGDSHLTGASFTMPTSDETLYAQWTGIDNTLTYYKNDGSETTTSAIHASGDSVTLTDQGFTRTGYSFAEWNTSSSGLGSGYNAGTSYTMPITNTGLYAQWSAEDYHVTYFGNGSTGGSVPTDGTDYHINDSVTVLGNTGSLVNGDNTFMGWNTASNGSGTDYVSGSALTMASSDVNLYAIWASSDASLIDLELTRGTLSPTFTSSGLSYDVDVANSVNTTKVIPTANDGNATITVKGESVASGTTSSSISLGQGDNIINVVVTAADQSTQTYTITVDRQRDDDDDDDESEQEGATVIVNGRPQTAGTEEVGEEDGKTTVEFNVNSQVLDEKIDEILGEKDEDDDDPNTAEIIVSSAADADVVQAVLTGDIVKKMEDNEFEVSIVTDDIAYTIPAMEFGIVSVANHLGVSVDSLESIEVDVEIENIEESQANEMILSANEQGYEVVFPPVEFTIRARTTSTSGEENEVIISQFSTYVERQIALPDGADPDQISTGILYNQDGILSHIPTEIITIEGVTYARLSSLTNSSYSIIWNPVTVASVETHWSKSYVNDMASRLIITDTESFSPDEAITRGEFADFIVKALGIYKTGVAEAGQFSDVSVSDEHANAIAIAVEYGIVLGYTDGTFRADNTITREEAMTMYARAMDVVDLVGTDDDRIDDYIDESLISAWAYDYVKKTLSAGVFNGRTSDTIVPDGTFTFAEAATAIRNLLVESELINE